MADAIFLPDGRCIEKRDVDEPDRRFRLFLVHGDTEEELYSSYMEQGVISWKPMPESERQRPAEPE
jgi:hypothetical protein